MKKQKHFLTVLVLLIGLMLSSTSFSQTGSDKGIHFFEGSMKEAMVKAKEEKKYIFLDAYASWCGPCKTMEKEVYTDRKVSKYFNNKFISVKIDMEKGEGPNLAKLLPSINGYPSLLFFNPDGSLAKTVLGSRNTKDFLKEAMLVAK